MWFIHRKEKWTETVPRVAQTLGLLEKYLTSVVLKVQAHRAKGDQRTVGLNKENISKEIEMIRSNQIEILEQKGTVTEMKSSLKGSVADVSRRRQKGFLGDRPNDITQSEEQKEKGVENVENLGPDGTLSTCI